MGQSGGWRTTGNTRPLRLVGLGCVGLDRVVSASFHRVFLRNVFFPFIFIFSIPLFAGRIAQLTASHSLYSRIKTVIEIAIQSCLNVATLSLESKAKARVMRARARLSSGGHLSGMEGELS